MLRLTTVLCAITAAAYLGGCAVGPTYQRPIVNVPNHWVAQAADGLWPADDWWIAFNDPTLDHLVAEGLSTNHDLKAAIERVHEAQSLAKVAGAPLFPTVSAEAGGGRERAFKKNPNKPQRYDDTYTQLGLTASYELDLFGQNRDQLKAANAKVESSEFDRDAVRVGLASAVASTYLQLCSANERLAIARDSLASARDTLDLVRAQLHGGTATALQVAQQQSEAESLAASIPPIETERSRTWDALARLVGTTPEALNVTPSSLMQMSAPVPPTGLPSALLERRPDVQKAEADLRAANADVGAATAALFPKVNLSALGGYGTVFGLDSLFLPASQFYGLAVGLSAPLFDGGKLRGELNYSQARYQELVENYQQAAISAFGDVDDALAAERDSQAALEARHVATVSAAQASELAKAQFQQGMADYLSVLVTQRTVLNARDAEVQARLARLEAAIGVFQALGGGWSSSGASEPVAGNDHAPNP
jgi:NodT family efflux transporter outer membrane factor (OMF) lipoprotein